MSTSPATRRGYFAVCAVYCMLLAGAYGWTLLPRYLEGLGWSGTEIGTLFSARKVCSTSLLAIWAMVADRTGASRTLAIAQLAIGSLAIWALATTQLDWVVWAGALLFAGTAGCVLPIIDAIALGSYGAERYGAVRAWGTLGFGVSALLAAVVGGTLGYVTMSAWAPIYIASLVVLAALSSLLLSKPKAGARPKSPTSLKSFALIATRPELLFILGMSALHWACQAPFNLFLVQLCEEKGAASWAPGAAVALGVTLEFVVLNRSERLLERASPAALLCVAFGVSAARWALTAEATNPFVIVGLQAAHGASFGIFLVALIAAISRRVPAELRTSGQALLHLAVFGLGGLIGPPIAGWVYDQSGAPPLFWLAAIGDLALLAPALVWWRRVKRQPPE